MIKYCKSCNSTIPNERLRVVPHTIHCVNCSTVDKVSAIPIIHHKTGNEIQIVADPEVAAEFHRLSSRVGFGTLRGLKAGKSGGTDVKSILDKSKPRTNIFIPMADAETFNKLGEKVMDAYDLTGRNRAMQIIQEAVTTRLVSEGQGSKLKKIIEALSDNQTIELSVKKESYIPKNIKQDTIVSNDISYVFNHWKRN
jgi:hypothetical protein